MSLPIFTFFPKQNKSTNANSFYAQNLPKTSKSVPQSVPTTVSKESNAAKNRLEKLEVENVQLKTENGELKSEIEKLRKENVKKQNDLKNLLKLHKETFRLYVNSQLKVKLLNKSVNGQSQVLYETFKNVFGENVLKQLRKIQGEKRGDSSFILICMRELCKDIDIKSVTASGTRKGRKGRPTVSLEVPKEKSPLPTEKREILESIFLERLASAKLNDSEQNVRYLLLNRHINVALFNIKHSIVSVLDYIWDLMC